MELTILNRHWADKVEVPEEDATALLVEGILLDGEEVLAGEAFLDLGTGKITSGTWQEGDFRVFHPPRAGKVSGFATLILKNVDEDWFFSLGPNDFAQYSNPGRCEIIIHSIKTESPES